MRRRRRLIAEYSSRSDPRAVADFAAQVLMLDLRPKLKSITVPVVEISPFYAPDFAAMGVDEAGKTNYYRMLLNGIEKLDVLSVSPARHFVMFDQPEKFAAALDEALAKVYAKPTTQLGLQLHQVPESSVEILEHGDGAVRRLAGFADEFDAA